MDDLDKIVEAMKDFEVSPYEEVKKYLDESARKTAMRITE